MSATPHFRDLTRREVEAVQRRGTIVDLPARRFVAGRDRYPEQVFIVIRGQIAAMTDYGRRRYLWAGDCFGMFAADDSGCAGRETFEALTPVTVFVMTRREFASLESECPRLRARLVAQLAETRAVPRSESRGLELAVAESTPVEGDLRELGESDDFAELSARR